MSRIRAKMNKFRLGFLSNFRGIKGRIIGTSFAIAFLLLAVGVFGVYTVKKVSESYSKVSDVYEPASRNLVQLLADAREVILIVNMLTTAGDDQNIVGELNGQYDTAATVYNDQQELVKKMYISFNDEESYNTIREKWKPILANSNELMNLSFSSNPEDKKKFKEIIVGPFSQARIDFMQTIDKLIQKQKSLSDVAHKEAETTVQFSNRATVAAVGVGFILALLLGYIVSNILSRQLLHVSQQLSAGAEEVADAASRIQAASENLSSSAAQQAASMEETTTSTTQLNAMVSKNAESAASSRNVSKEGREGAERGKSMVSQLAIKMDDISESNADIANQVQASNQALQNIITVIKEISSKTQVINDIVFQTKLLSFNAAVEAARAGEHGKGFAVVADEVGKLAEMSGVSSKEISSMLNQSTIQVEKIINETKSKVTHLIELGSKKINDGVADAKKSEMTLDEIAASIAQVDAMVSEIAEASANQAGGVNEISKAITQLQGLTQNNVSVSHEASASASQLSASARSLATMADELLITVTGSSKNAQVFDEHSEEGSSSTDVASEQDSNKNVKAA